MKKRMKTLCGTTATRRVSWIQPHTTKLENGDTFIDIFMYVELTKDEKPYRLLYAGAQLGMDKKGRVVLPGSIVAANRENVFAYGMGMPINKVRETAENVVDKLNDSITGPRAHWWAPAGLTRGKIDMAAKP